MLELLLPRTHLRPEAALSDDAELALFRAGATSLGRVVAAKGGTLRRIWIGPVPELLASVALWRSQAALSDDGATATASPEPTWSFNTTTVGPRYNWERSKQWNFKIQLKVGQTHHELVGSDGPSSGHTLTPKHVPRPRNEVESLFFAATTKCKAFENLRMTALFH